MHKGALVVLGFTLAFGSAAPAQDKIVGSVEFLSSCAGCHGTDARGSGPVAPQLVVKPPDLTGLAERNQGQFPFLKVFMTIDGRATISAHGNRTMPVWGDRFQSEADPKQINPYGAEQIVRGRILELVNYLEAIQVGPKREQLIAPAK